MKYLSHCREKNKDNYIGIGAIRDVEMTSRCDVTVLLSILTSFLLIYIYSQIFPFR